MKAEFRTAKGTAITVEILTSKMADADGIKIEVPDWTLRVTAAGKTITSVELVALPKHGLCIRQRSAGGITIPVPEASQAAVSEIFAAYSSKFVDEIGREIDSHRAAITAAMAE